jgi:hypothetical protein
MDRRVVDLADDLCSEAYNLNAYIFAETHSQGKWQDDVGLSYNDYTERVMQMSSRAKDIANTIVSAGTMVDEIDEAADKRRLESLRGRVNGL